MGHFKEINSSILNFTKNYDTIVWDWNGTLINDVDTAVNCINKLLPLYEASLITPQRYREIFEFPVRKYYENLGLNLDKYSFEEIRDQYVKDYNIQSLNASLFPETIELLEEIKKTKQQYILSAVSQWHLDSITRHFKVDHLFHEKFGVDNHYASSKLARGEEFIKITGITPSRTLLIGDTLHDFEVATKLGFDCLLLADGHQSHERLKSTAPHVLSGRRTY